MKKLIPLLVAACFASAHAHTLASPEAPPKAAIENKEQTLSIIKPDAVAGNHIGEIVARFEKNGLKIVAIKMVHLNKQQAGEFYQEHQGRPFYPELVEFMSSTPAVIMVLEGPDAVQKK